MGLDVSILDRQDAEILDRQDAEILDRIFAVEYLLGLYHTPP
jgi:hypothetical protein